ncbi:hypothetical protein [Allocoleopsis sp.]
MNQGTQASKAGQRSRSYWLADWKRRLVKRRVCTLQTGWTDILCNAIAR